MPRKFTSVISGDWVSVENNFNLIARNLSEISTPKFAGLYLSGLTAGLLHSNALGVISAGSLYVPEYGALVVND